ncbi:hypothetical protein J3F84DRAFT_357488 [Trichoderma pleuroticola]
MTSGSGVCCVCRGALVCASGLGPEKSTAPRVTTAWANRSAGRRAFGLAEVRSAASMPQ